MMFKYMAWVDWFFRKRSSNRIFRDGERLLEVAEQADQDLFHAETQTSRADVGKVSALALAKLLEAKNIGFSDEDHFNLRFAQALFFLQKTEEALAPALAAATARPYDVDSRLILGRVRLALGQLTQSDHEFSSILEEFGREVDAMDGLRAVSMARGEQIFELDDSDEERTRAAEFLVSTWDCAGVTKDRFRDLKETQGNTPLIALLDETIARRGGKSFKKWDK